MPTCLAAMILALATAQAAADGAASTGPGAPAAETVQTQCPVMVGNKILPEIHTVYQGKKVYFCCLSCKAKFLADPMKYVAHLPQFAATPGPAHDDHGDDEHEHAHGDGFSTRRLIVPMGIVTFVLIALTVLLGLLRRVRALKPRLLLRLHKICGCCALASATIHGGLVLFGH